MEHNIRSFDISTPLGAFHFALFLLRLRARDQDSISSITRDAFNKGFGRNLLGKLASGSCTQSAMTRPPPEKESDTAQPAESDSAQATERQPGSAVPSTLGHISEGSESGEVGEETDAALAGALDNLHVDGSPRGNKPADDGTKTDQDKGKKKAEDKLPEGKQRPASEKKPPSEKKSAPSRKPPTAGSRDGSSRGRGSSSRSK